MLHGILIISNHLTYFHPIKRIIYFVLHRSVDRLCVLISYPFFRIIMTRTIRLLFVAFIPINIMVFNLFSINLSTSAFLHFLDNVDVLYQLTSIADHYKYDMQQLRQDVVLTGESKQMLVLDV